MHPILEPLQAHFDHLFDLPIIQNDDSHMTTVPIAVAVSGGADSMALAHMLSAWAKTRREHIIIHILVVDHGLRAAAKDEALAVQDYFSHDDLFCPVIFTVDWDGDKPATGVMKLARDKRYALMHDYCLEHGIHHLYLGHHQDDQAETFLMRLVKGSGLDGLAAMHDHQIYDETQSVLYLLRPLLGLGHQDLVSYCKDQDVTWYEDPTNQDHSYTRNRVRALTDVLANEGLTSKKLSITAKRMARARHCLSFFTGQAYEESLYRGVDDDNVRDELIYVWDVLRGYPDEIILRVLLHSFDLLCPDQYYRPRMEKLEDLLQDLLCNDQYKARTLGGLEIRRRKDFLVISKE